ncbi:DUF3114 domain-containing protein [Lactobacillus rodentium]|uniref:LXG domain-containing protein n=1 Tax=Lactobacillus rodentium TaxID=947835 RepID=A0A2Z6TEM0_9LACO|nr:hypothetical protein [Lactobacillus rodentium]MCR1894343.1 DUF3114 domain-containing protein [Lactobacillus rodentium]GBG04640.1 hypothetical protein LrDSM24759_05540 [Lactobacillus rodentium]
MGLIYVSSESEHLIETTRHNIGEVKEVVKKLKVAKDNLVNKIGTLGMEGLAYEAGEFALENEVVPLINQLEHVAEQMKSQLTIYIHANSLVNHWGYLDEDRLESLITSTRSKINRMHELQSTLDKVGVGGILNPLLQSAEAQLHEYHKMLRDLREFNQNTANLFTRVTSDLRMLTGKLTGILFDKVNFEQILDHKIKGKETDEIYQFEVDIVVALIAKGRPKQEIELLKQQLTQQVKEMAGIGEWWDPAAVNAYLKHIIKYTVNDAKNSYLSLTQTISDYWNELHLVGSDLYTDVFEASKLDKMHKLKLMQDQLGSEVVEDENFLQLNANGNAKYHLQGSINPLSKFFPVFRQTVIDAYGEKTNGLDCKDDLKVGATPLGEVLHLFRSYLDHTYIQFIKEYDGKHHNLPKNATDYQRFLQFLKDNNLEADYQTGANYHNRTLKGQFKYPENMKVQLKKDSKKEKNNAARMIEYIFNIKTGQLVSEWNAYDKHMHNGKIDLNPADYSEEDLYQIANTESFNYGIPKGSHKKLSRQYKETHNKLDINHPKDPKLRQLATSEKKHQYVAEEDLQDGGNYVNIVGAGGEKDVKAWNKIPASQKQKAYKRYVKWVKGAREKRQFLGFNDFMKEKSK